MNSITEAQREDFKLAIVDGMTIKAAAEHAGISYSTGKNWRKQLGDEIVDLAREKLALASLKAVDTAIEMMDADAQTEKAEVRLAAAEKIMDRVGLTKHTSVEVKVENENGIFILPGKNHVPKASESDSEA